MHLLTLAALACAASVAHRRGTLEAGRAKGGRLRRVPRPGRQQRQPGVAEARGAARAYIVQQIEAFKAGTRSNPLMCPIAAGLTPQDAAELGAYYASLPVKVGTADPALVRTGERLYRGGNRAKSVSACIACHGPDGRGNQPAGIPSLSGQHAVYTAAQLKAYAVGERRSDPNQIMRNVATLMSPEEIAAIASYVEGLH